MNELAGPDTHRCTDDRSDKVDPQSRHVAGHNRRGQRAGGIHRGTANWTSEQGLETDHASDRNPRHQPLLFGTAGHSQDHEHQHARQNYLQHEGLPSGTGRYRGSEVFVRGEHGPQHAAGSKRSHKLTQDVRDDSLPRKPFGDPETHGHSGIEVSPGHVTDGVDHGHDDEAERQGHAHVGDLAARDIIDDDGPRSRKDEAERADDLCG